MEKNKNIRFGLMYTSVYSIIGGFGLNLFGNVLSDNSIGLFAKIFEYGGILGMAYYGWTYSKFTKLFENLGLGVDNVYPIQKSKEVGEYSTVYKFTLPCGLSVKDFDDKKDAIEQYLGRDIDIKYTYKEIFIEVFDKDSLAKIDYDENISVKGDVAFPLGYTRHGELVICDLSKGDDNTHMLVGSTTGGGKSVLLKVVLTFLITKKFVDIYLMDFKGSEFFIFEKCSCIKEVCYDPERALAMLESLSNVMKDRYTLFRSKGVRDIWDYNKKYKNKMKHIVVVADEFSELMEYKDCQREMERLTQLGRAAGFNFIVCTQRPDAKVVNGRIKNNFSVVAGLKTNTDINSRIIINNDSLSKLRGRGHCIFRYAGIDQELQVMYISDEQIQKLIKPFEIQKQPIKEIINGNVINFDCLEAFDDNNKRSKNN